MHSRIHKYQCLWTTHLTQKSKSWHDGTLKIYEVNKKANLHDEDGIIVDSHFLVQTEWENDDELKLDKCLVLILEKLGIEERNVSIIRDLDKSPSQTQKRTSLVPRSLELMPHNIDNGTGTKGLEGVFGAEVGRNISFSQRKSLGLKRQRLNIRGTDMKRRDPSSQSESVIPKAIQDVVNLRINPVVDSVPRELLGVDFSDCNVASDFSDCALVGSPVKDNRDVESSHSYPFSETKQTSRSTPAMDEIMILEESSSPDSVVEISIHSTSVTTAALDESEIHTDDVKRFNERNTSSLSCINSGNTREIGNAERAVSEALGDIQSSDNDILSCDDEEWPLEDKVEEFDNTFDSSFILTFPLKMDEFGPWSKEGYELFETRPSGSEHHK